ncbi:MAG: calcium/sodium antiporter [Candidatus Saganbacteria bacterium]|nr:calcium/sodium antiporter [Candidatus Saganbacteria bacterium]
MLLINALVFFAAAALIVQATSLFLNGAVSVAEALRFKKIFIAATIVSLVTTLPELVVSVTASYLGQEGLAVGNVIGSCICNLGLILAVGAIIEPVDLEPKDFRRRTFLLLGSLLLVLLFSLDGSVSRPEAVCLLALLTVYLYFYYRAARRHRAEVEAELPPEARNRSLPWGLGMLFGGGVLTVFLARYGLIETGLNLAQALGLPQIVIGLSLTAVGTSLPELFTSVISSRRRHGEIVLGNVIGANILNLLLVLGLAALVRPLVIERQAVLFHLPFALFLTVIMLWAGWRGRSLGRRAGWSLLGFYVIYIASLYISAYK